MPLLDALLKRGEGDLMEDQAEEVLGRLIRGVVALLRLRLGRATPGERSDVVARALVARARRLT